MMIECLVRREGPTVMTIGNLKTKYTFTPIPGARPGEMVTSVCDIVAPEHIAYMLGRTQFRQYDSDVSQKELRLQRSKERKGVYQGYSVEKFQDKGYIVVNRKDKAKTLYAASNKPFTDKLEGMIPWPTEFEAFEWLKGELEFSTLDEEFQEAEPEVDIERVASLEQLVEQQNMGTNGNRLWL